MQCLNLAKTLQAIEDEIEKVEQDEERNNSKKTFSPRVNTEIKFNRDENNIESSKDSCLDETLKYGLCG